jgi:hypothetical protein
MVGDKYQVIKEMALCDNNYVIAGVILEVIKIQNSFVLVQSVSSKITPISVATAVLHAHSVKIDK